MCIGRILALASIGDPISAQLGALVSQTSNASFGAVRRNAALTAQMRSFTDAQPRAAIYRCLMIASITATALLAARLASCLLAADFLSGLLHWYEDTWLVPGRNAFLDHWIVEPNID